MEKNDVFKFTAPNGVEVTAIVVHSSWHDWMNGYGQYIHLCYAQNRLFTFEEFIEPEETKEVLEPWFHYVKSGKKSRYFYGEVIVDYCIMPELDTLLYGNSEEDSENDEDLPIEHPHYDDELEALESLKKYI